MWAMCATPSLFDRMAKKTSTPARMATKVFARIGNGMGNGISSASGQNVA